MSRVESMSQIPSLGTPQSDERVLWQGKPDLGALARTAFHTRKIAAYFAILVVTALAMGSAGVAALTMFGGLVTLGLFYSFAWLAHRTSSYVLTDRRLILNIGMAVEKSVNLPLKKIASAHMTDRGAGVGDIAIELGGAHGLGYAMLWPHARPLKIAKPQPMMRAIPDIETVAATLASAVAAHQPIARADLSAAGAPAPVGQGIEGALA